MTEVKAVITVQARLNSERLPRKIMMDMNGKRMIDRVLQSCQKAVRKQKLHIGSSYVKASLALAIPETDESILEINTNGIQIVRGSENDVLSRYYRVLQETHADFIVRVTADCPMIPHYLINQHITMAVSKNFDYYGNSDPRCRTSPDGWDCEVLSSRYLEHAYHHAVSSYDREHVTPFMRTKSSQFKIGCVVNYFDFAGIKLSVDTKDDLIFVTEMIKRVEGSFSRAQEIYGIENVDRF